MSELRVIHEGKVVGRHDARCGPPMENIPFDQQPYHRRHEGATLVVVEDGHETRYAPDQWSLAGIDLEPTP